MPRIDVTTDHQRWAWECPDCTSTNWQANNGSFYCRNCQQNLDGLVHKKTGRYHRREEIEFVGPHTSWKAPYRASPEK